MRGSYSLVARKMRSQFDTRTIEDGEYFFENDAVLGRVDELDISQYFVETPDGIQLLVFAKNLKKKFGSDIRIADVVFLQRFDGENRVIFCKKRAFSLIRDNTFLTKEIKPIGYAEVTDEGLLLRMQCLAVEEVVQEHEDLDDGRRVYIRASRKKRMKNAP